MKKHRTLIAVFLGALAFGLTASAQSAKKGIPAGQPDKAYLQKIWNGWSTLDPANVAQFYASGPHTFFDIAPLKYGSWDEYETGVTKELADYKTAKFTVNDDVELHPAGNYLWGTARLSTR